MKSSLFVCVKNLVARYRSWNSCPIPTAGLDPETDGRVRVRGRDGGGDHDDVEDWGGMPLGRHRFLRGWVHILTRSPGLLYRGGIGRGPPARGVSDSISWGRRYWLLELAPFRIIRCRLFLFSLASGLIKTPTPLRRDLYIPSSSLTNSCISASLSAGSACPFAMSFIGQFHVRGVFSCHLTVRCFAIQG